MTVVVVAAGGGGGAAAAVVVVWCSGRINHQKSSGLYSRDSIDISVPNIHN